MTGLAERSALARRVVTVPAVFLAALALTVSAPLWLVAGATADMLVARRRLPTVRLLAFATGWTWLEVAGVCWAAWLWVAGRRGDLDRHYELQAWWVQRLMRVLTATTGLRITAPDAALLSPGPVVMLCRHASLADSLVSAWVVAVRAGMRPHYVLKRELLLVPNLDVVGNRLPNCFVDRDALDAAAELDKVRATAARLSGDDVMIIFPEGTRATAAKRHRALARIAERDPSRAARLAGLRRLLPPRPGGTLALLQGAPQADVVLAWHRGFDGWDDFAGIHRALRRAPEPIEFRMRRVARRDVPVGGEAAWLDDVWLQLDAAVQSGHGA